MSAHQLFRVSRMLLVRRNTPKVQRSIPRLQPLLVLHTTHKAVRDCQICKKNGGSIEKRLLTAFFLQEKYVRNSEKRAGLKNLALCIHRTPSFFWGRSHGFMELWATRIHLCRTAGAPDTPVADAAWTNPPVMLRTL